MENNNYYVGMSGGVDSSVAAYILKQEGKNVKGIYANCFYSEEQCRSSEDLSDAINVASSLGIKLSVKDYRKEYDEKVLKYFYKEYGNGRTPNPDILCNSEIKFGVMAYDMFSQDNKACLVTGHYVANKLLSRDEWVALLSSSRANHGSIKCVADLIYRGTNKCLRFLMSGVDGAKDQSYFLYRLYDKTEKLNRYDFPLGEMTKVKVRTLAQSAGLTVADKRDSQGICFIGNIKLKDFIKDHLVATPGTVYDETGNEIGSHDGVQFYTIGQRHGFTVKAYSHEPLYIVEKNISGNYLIVGPRSKAFSSEFTVTNSSFPYGIENVIEDFNDLGISVRVRNLGKKIPCEVTTEERLGSSKILHVKLSEPEFGVSPGQSAVFYVDRLMLGGGIIDSTILIS